MQHLFTVNGMSCQHCVKAITAAIRALDPEARVQVDLDSRQVQVESEQSRSALAQAIRDEGYTVLD
jgi:copper chaperone